MNFLPNAAGSLSFQTHSFDGCFREYEVVSKIDRISMSTASTINCTHKPVQQSQNRPQANDPVDMLIRSILDTTSYSLEFVESWRSKSSGVNEKTVPDLRLLSRLELGKKL